MVRDAEAIAVTLDMARAGEGTRSASSRPVQAPRASMVIEYQPCRSFTTLGAPSGSLLIAVSFIRERAARLRVSAAWPYPD